LAVGRAVTGWSVLGWVAVAVGLGGVVASGMLYVLPSRPSWYTPATPATFLTTTAVAAAVASTEPALLTAVVATQLAIGASTVRRLANGRRPEGRDAVRLLRGRGRPALVARVALAAAGITGALAGWPLAALLCLAAEALGRWLFFVTAVPLDVPGSFQSGRSALARGAVAA
jgi:DMSO reductase anchor subunit